MPPDRTDRVREVFADDPGPAHLAVLPGSSVSPRGDLLLADVARESADALVGALRELGIHRDGAIAITSVDAAVSSAARQAEERAPGDDADAVVWEQVVRTTDADSSLSVSCLAFLTIATMLAAIAIINDSAILTNGAMVLGPEFVPLAALAVAAVQRRPPSARRAATTLVMGFVVAVLAGVAGVLSLTSAKSGALVGVFIPLTTVPAAADMAVSLALGGGTEFRSAATRLGINLSGIVVAATVTLAVQRTVWRRVPGVVPRMGTGRR